MSDARSQLYQHNAVAKALNTKWAPLLEGIESDQLRMTTAVLLENENQRGGLLTEDPVFPNVSGTFSGQTANAGGYDFSAGDGTGAGADVSPFQHYLLPLVRRVYPNLIANELVGVQPMTSPASLVFYLKYRYTGLVNPDVVQGNRVVQQAVAKGANQPGTEYGNFIGNSWNIDPYYSLQTVFRENIGATAAITINNGATSAVLDLNPLAAPVVENTATVQAGTVGLVVTDATTGDTSLIQIPVDTAGLATAVPTVTALTGAGVAGLVAGDVGATVNGVTVASIIIGTPVVDLADAGGTGQTGTVRINIGATTNGISAVRGATDTELTVSGPACRTYDYNMEGNRTLPEMELQVESFPVAAKTRKLRTKWTIEASQDLRAMHNIDAEQELIAVLANEVTAEIDREIINDLIVNAFIRVDYDYSNPFLTGGLIGATTVGSTSAGGGFVPGIGAGAAIAGVPGVTSFDDRNKALFYQILEVSNQIYRQSLRGAGNWVVTSPEIAAKLESMLEFKPDARTDTMYNLGIVYTGTLNGQFRLYKDPLFPSNLILVGYKGSSFMDAGYFYCPYVPLQLTPTVLDTESFNPRKGLITRYGKVLVENGARMYGLIRVFNITAVGANTLPGADSVGTVAQTQTGEITNSVASTNLPISGDQKLI